jgi:hypothetical protein
VRPKSLRNAGLTQKGVLGLQQALATRVSVVHVIATSHQDYECGIAKGQ